MSMIMNHDITSLMGQRIMMKNSLAMKRSLEKLSTGLRTKIADVDNTAGLAISETMRSRIYGMEKALNNSQDGISLVQTASGALEQTQSMLMRMRELSVQAANDTLTQQDRSYIQVEINEIRKEITRIGDTTQFNRKNILSGDNAVLWSSTDKNVKAIVNGGIRSIDQFGQKYTVEGNYKISVRATAGKAEVQKSDIFRVKHDNTVTDKNVNAASGIKDVAVSGNMPAGNYTLKTSEAEGQDAKITGSFGIGEAADGTFADVSDVFNIEVSDGLTDNASILFEVKNINEANGTINLRATANILTQEGVAKKAVLEDIMLAEGDEGVNLGELFGEESVNISFNGIEFIGRDSKFVVNVSAQSPADNAIGVDLSGTLDSSYPDKWDGGPFKGENVHYVLDGTNTGNKELRFNNFFINSKTGQVSEGTVILETDETFRAQSAGGKIDTDSETMLANFSAAYIGKVADGDTKLRDIDKFWDAQGNFILDEPKELTLTQGDGTQAKVMLYADDSLKDVARKLNDAVSLGLGQSQFVDDAANFVSFVEGATSGTEAVAGTMVIRSVLAGQRGEITLSGNEDVLKAFSLNTIQDSSENQYEVTVRDAHSNSVVAENVKITGNRLVGVIHKNIDVEFDSMMGISAKWNESTKNFAFSDTSNGKPDEILLHLADNTTVLQTGTGEGEDVMLNIGDMRSHALGLDGVNVMNQKAAAKSTAIIDAAIDKVSMQQAKLGAAQNRLEHHIGNLTDEMEALTSANSRIRDTDYAQEILEFTKMRILMEANSAMLAQSNTIQQNSILSLLR